MAGWSIGKHRLVVDPRTPMLSVFIDEERVPDFNVPTHILGDYPLKVGKRKVLIRRVRNLDVARTEVWIDGIKVPFSEDPIPLRKPQKDATCKVHPKGAGGYRDQGLAPEAKIACGVCRDPLCAACTAVDGVRCKACFEKGAVEMAKLERELRIKGPLIAFALCLLMFVFGMALGIPKIAGGGISLAFLVAFKLGHGYWKEKREAKMLPKP